ncbi:MAG: hypothetical protein IPJ62_16255 [Betaproteobacteria bacterium]|nr:hypothetical protein [Betaproteobacteria bacterium]
MPQAIDILETSIFFGPTRHFGAPGVVFQLQVPALGDTDCGAVRMRVSDLLHGVGLRLDPARNPVPEVHGREFIGQQFGELAIVFQRATDAGVRHCAVMVEGAEDRVKVPGEGDQGTAFTTPGMLALKVLNAALSASDSLELKLDDELGGFLDYAAERMLDPNARLILAAARRYGIPVLDLDQDPFAATRVDSTIGHGPRQLRLCARQHRFLGAMPQGGGETPPWIYRRSRDAPVAGARPAPVPRQDLEFPNKHRYGRVLRAAERIGFPVVLKRPVSGEAHDALPTSGVVGPIHDADQLERAFTRCFEPTSPVWVESYVPGTTYRFLVMDSEPVSVVRLRAPAVVGDGQRE